MPFDDAEKSFLLIIGEIGIFALSPWLPLLGSQNQLSYYYSNAVRTMAADKIGKQLLSFLVFLAEAEEFMSISSCKSNGLT